MEVIHNHVTNKTMKTHYITKNISHAATRNYGGTCNNTTELASRATSTQRTETNINAYRNPRYTNVENTNRERERRGEREITETQISSKRNKSVR